MSLEKQIADNTAANSDLATAIRELTAAILAATSSSAGAVAATTEAPATTTRKRTTAADKAATQQAAEPEAKTTTEPETTAPETKAEAEAEKPVDDCLPEGKRDTDFFMAHIAPTMAQLVAIDRDTVKAINTSFGVARPSIELDPSRWGEFLKAVKDKLAEAENNSVI